MKKNQQKSPVSPSKTKDATGRKNSKQISSGSFFASFLPYAEFALILFMVFITYGNSIKNDYNIDDGYIVSLDEGNKLTKKGISAIPEIFTTNYSTGPGVTYGYRPLGKATMAIEYSLWGNNPQNSHFVNILLYALNIFLLLLFLKKIAALFHFENIRIIYLSLLVFIVHPIHTEVVCSIKNREELLCFIFTLSALLTYFKISETRKWQYIPLLLLFTILAFFAKQTAVNIFSILLLIILFREWMLKAEINTDWQRLAASTWSRIKLNIRDRKKGWYAILFILGSILVINIFDTIGLFVSLAVLSKWVLRDNQSAAAMRFKSIASVTNLLVLLSVFYIYQLVMNYIPAALPEGDIGKQFESNPYYFSPDAHSFPNGIQTLLFYVKKLFVPYPLLFFYGYNMLPDQGWNSVYPYIGIFIFLLTASLLFLLITRKKALFFVFWLLFFGAAIFPFSNLLKNFYVTGIVGERLIYQASAGFCVLLVLGIDAVSGIVKTKLLKQSPITRQQLLFSVVAILSAVFFIMTVDRNKDWMDKTTLYRNDIPFLSNSARANYMIASNYMRIVDSPGGTPLDKEQALNDAKSYYNRALQLYPEFDDALLRMGTLYNVYLSMPDSALQYYSKVDTIAKIKYVRARELMGSIYQKRAEPLKALEYYREAFRLYPQDYPVYQEMIIILLDSKQYDEIIPLADIAIRNKWPEGYANKGDAYLNKRDTVTAISYYKKALENGFKNEVLMKNLDYYYKLKEQRPE